MGLGALTTACVRGGTKSSTSSTPVSATSPAGPADQIVLGRVLTFDSTHPEATAVAIAGSQIIAVGERDAVMDQRGPATEILDVGAGLVTPGLVDAHAHLMGLGATLEQIDVRGARSIAEVIRRIRAMDRGQPWLLGRGWDQNLWPGKTMPTHEPLTEAFPDRPVWIRRVDGHAGWANQATLNAAGIGADTRTPDGGEILRTPDGHPTGVLVDAATALVQPPPPGPKDRQRQLDTAQSHVLARGLTGVHDMGVSAAVDALYRERATARDPARRLGLRVFGYADADWLPVLAAERTAERPTAEDRYTLLGVKLYADGALGSRGAALLAPYHDRPNHRGLMQQDPSTLRAACEQAAGGGWQIATHAIGDAANRLVLDTYAAVIRHHGLTDARLRIEHAQVVDPTDIPRFAEHGVIASMQPTHATSDMPWAPDRLGPDRLAGAYAWRRFLDAGVRLCFGSDFPVERVDVTHGLHAAVTRQDAQGQPAGGWRPDQRLTLSETIAAFCYEAAFASFCEGFLGMIKAGYQADLTCFRDDLRSLPPSEIREANVAATLVGGEVRYRA
ncbi:MAG: amidohydrolase [Myxococcota bacterium]